jgi:hypothetical protein
MNNELLAAPVAKVRGAMMLATGVQACARGRTYEDGITSASTRRRARVAGILDGAGGVAGGCHEQADAGDR